VHSDTASCTVSAEVNCANVSIDGTDVPRRSAIFLYRRLLPLSLEYCDVINDYCIVTISEVKSHSHAVHSLYSTNHWYSSCPDWSGLTGGSGDHYPVGGDKVPKYCYMPLTPLAIYIFGVAKLQMFHIPQPVASLFGLEFIRMIAQFIQPSTASSYIYFIPGQPVSGGTNRKRKEF